GMDVVAQSELVVGSVEETGLTFVEDAIIKARHAAKVTGLPAIADDSGISDDYLVVAPAIYSSLQTGTDDNDCANIVKLLAALVGVPAALRQANFNCVLVT
ncbi:non-canonical purine NTP pyrophosphatase, partial [Morganella morganii]|uniref:non-canonical purine NTP pyrophosphatase n=1 Tax=Morganella morganii TaxID=582 RepID=UPI0019E5B005